MHKVPFPVHTRLWGSGATSNLAMERIHVSRSLDGLCYIVVLIGLGQTCCLSAYKHQGVKGCRKETAKRPRHRVPPGPSYSERQNPKSARTPQIQSSNVRTAQGPVGLHSIDTCFGPISGHESGCMWINVDKYPDELAALSKTREQTEDEESAPPAVNYLQVVHILLWGRTKNCRRMPLS